MICYYLSTSIVKHGSDQLFARRSIMSSTERNPNSTYKNSAWRSLEFGLGESCGRRMTRILACPISKVAFCESQKNLARNSEASCSFSDSLSDCADDDLAPGEQDRVDEDIVIRNASPKLLVSSTCSSSSCSCSDAASASKQLENNCFSRELNPFLVVEASNKTTATKSLTATKTFEEQSQQHFVVVSASLKNHKQKQQQRSIATSSNCDEETTLFFCSCAKKTLPRTIVNNQRQQNQQQREHCQQQVVAESLYTISEPDSLLKAQRIGGANEDEDFEHDDVPCTRNSSICQELLSKNNCNIAQIADVCKPSPDTCINNDKLCNNETEADNPEVPVPSSNVNSPHSQHELQQLQPQPQRLPSCNRDSVCSSWTAALFASTSQQLQVPSPSTLNPLQKPQWPNNVVSIAHQLRSQDNCAQALLKRTPDLVQRKTIIPRRAVPAMFSDPMSGDQRTLTPKLSDPCTQHMTNSFNDNDWFCTLRMPAVKPVSISQCKQQSATNFCISTAKNDKELAAETDTCNGLVSESCSRTPTTTTTVRYNNEMTSSCNLLSPKNAATTQPCLYVDNPRKQLSTFVDHYSATTRGVSAAPVIVNSTPAFGLINERQPQIRNNNWQPHFGSVYHETTFSGRCSSELNLAPATASDQFSNTSSVAVAAPRRDVAMQRRRDDYRMDPRLSDPNPMKPDPKSVLSGTGSVTSSSPLIHISACPGSRNPIQVTACNNLSSLGVAADRKDHQNQPPRFRCLSPDLHLNATLSSTSAASSQKVLCNRLQTTATSGLAHSNTQRPPYQKRHSLIEALSRPISSVLVSGNNNSTQRQQIWTSSSAINLSNQNCAQASRGQRKPPWSPGGASATMGSYTNAAVAARFRNENCFIEDGRSFAKRNSALRSTVTNTARLNRRDVSGSKLDVRNAVAADRKRNYRKSWEDSDVSVYCRAIVEEADRIWHRPEELQDAYHHQSTLHFRPAWILNAEPTRSSSSFSSNCSESQRSTLETEFPAEPGKSPYTKTTTTYFQPPPAQCRSLVPCRVNSPCQKQSAFTEAETSSRRCNSSTPENDVRRQSEPVLKDSVLKLFSTGALISTIYSSSSGCMRRGLQRLQRSSTTSSLASDDPQPGATMPTLSRQTSFDGFDDTKRCKALSSSNRTNAVAGSLVCGGTGRDSPNVPHNAQVKLSPCRATHSTSSSSCSSSTSFSMPAKTLCSANFEDARVSSCFRASDEVVRNNCAPAAAMPSAFVDIATTSTLAGDETKSVVVASSLQSLNSRLQNQQQQQRRCAQQFRSPQRLPITAPVTGSPNGCNERLAMPARLMRSRLRFTETNESATSQCRRSTIRRAQSQPMHINRTTAARTCLTVTTAACDDVDNAKDDGISSSEDVSDMENGRQKACRNVSDDSNRLSIYSTGSSFTGSSLSSDYCHDNSASSGEAETGGGLYVEALWDHVSILQDELPFRVGDVIEVVDTSDDTGLWYGCLNNRMGWFPAAYVRLLANQDIALVRELQNIRNIDADENNSDLFGTRNNCNEITNPHSSTETIIAVSATINCSKLDQTRANVIREIISTERDYVKLLEDLVDGFLKQALRRPDMFSEDRIAKIFGNLDRILELHQQFLADLEKQIVWQQLTRSKIGEVFLKHACRLLRDLTEIGLDGFLLTPVQRICKYPLQLGELAKCTSQEHPDFHNCQKALEAMKQVASAINDRKRRIESLQKLALWQQTIDGWQGESILKSSSVLVSFGDVSVKSLSGNTSNSAWLKDVVCFLFDHLLILCKKDLIRKSRLIFKDRIDTDSAVVSEFTDGKETQTGSSVKHAIKIESPATSKAYLLQFRSSKQRQQWLEVFAEERKIAVNRAYGPPSDEERRLVLSAIKMLALPDIQLDVSTKKQAKASKKQLPDLLLLPSESQLMQKSFALRSRKWTNLFGQAVSAKSPRNN